MKYIKNYEASSFSVKKLYDFKVGDYIKFNENYFDFLPFGKIVDFDYDDETYNKDDGVPVPYLVLLVNGSSVYMTRKMIERKLSEDEIEQFELELSIKKYNL